jgi:hypothetical protein
MRNVYVFNLPVADNMGREIPAIHHALKGALCRAFGGFTMTPNLEGGWIDPASGDLYLERVNSYRVGTDSEPDAFIAICSHYARLADQLAAYFEVNGAPRVVELKEESTYA